TGYRVERCQGSGCTTFAQVASVTGTSYSDTGLTPNTTYQYRVRAADAASNFSGYSSTAAAATQVAVDNCASPANPIVAENCLAGNPSSEWDISGAGDSSIQGYATEISIDRGQTVVFKVKTNA